MVHSIGWFVSQGFHPDCSDFLLLWTGLYKLVVVSSGASSPEENLDMVEGEWKREWHLYPPRHDYYHHRGYWPSSPSSSWSSTSQSSLPSLSLSLSLISFSLGEWWLSGERNQIETMLRFRLHWLLMKRIVNIINIPRQNKSSHWPEWHSLLTFALIKQQLITQKNIQQQRNKEAKYIQRHLRRRPYNFATALVFRNLID